MRKFSIITKAPFYKAYRTLIHPSQFVLKKIQLVLTQTVFLILKDGYGCDQLGMAKDLPMVANDGWFDYPQAKGS